MLSMRSSKGAFPIGLALFSMFFGAGNIIYPLSLGQYAGDKNFFAVAGLLLTAAVIPLAGVIAMVLFNGSYRNFFGVIGRVPGFFLSLMIISLLGPLGSTPRCIALSYATLKNIFFEIPLPLFSALACAVIFLFTVRKRHILTLLGWVLTPFLLFSLIAIIVLGLFNAPVAPTVDASALDMFFHGLGEGYNTMDLLAAFFFSSTIIRTLQSRDSVANPLRVAFEASMIAMVLLGAVYIGFSHIASLHAQDLVIGGKEELLSAISLKIAGPYAGLLVCTAIALACLTTAIALVAAFADFLQREVFSERVRYEAILIGTLFVTFFVSTFEFTGISVFLQPILQVCYPGLIALTLFNLAMKGLRTLKDRRV